MLGRQINTHHSAELKLPSIPAISKNHLTVSGMLFFVWVLFWFDFINYYYYSYCAGHKALTSKAFFTLGQICQGCGTEPAAGLVLTGCISSWRQFTFRLSHRVGFLLWHCIFKLLLCFPKDWRRHFGFHIEFQAPVWLCLSAQTPPYPAFIWFVSWLIPKAIDVIGCSHWML